MSKKVLIVEDDKSCSELYREQFEFSGYEVAQAWAGNGVVDKAKAQKPDAIILDLMLPGISGEEVLAKLRANDETKSIPVIILTALLQDKPKEEELRKLADDYAVKIDLMPKDLIARVEAMIANSDIKL